MQEVDPIAQFDFRISELERQMSQVLQMVRVSKVYDSPPDLGFVDVMLTTDLELKRRPIFTQRQGEDTSFWLPSVNECGLLLSPSGDVGNSIYLHGIGFDGFPVQAPDGDPLKVHQNTYRDGIKLIIDTETHTVQWENGTTKKIMERGKIEEDIGSNKEVLDAIAKTIIGAILYPTGVTTLQSPVGPVFFAPAPPPVSAPSPPAGSAPNSDGNVTKIPPSEVDSVAIRATSTLQLTLPAIPATVGGAIGTTSPGTYTATVTGTVNLTYPARRL